MNNSVIRSKVNGDIKEAYKPYVVDIGTENVTKDRCIIMDESGKECGVQLGKINQTIKRYCAREHKFDPVALAEVDVGPYTDKHAYMKDSMALTIGHNLPFNFWNSPLVKSRERRLQSGFIVNWSDKLVKRTLDDDDERYGKCSQENPRMHEFRFSYKEGLAHPRHRMPNY